MVIRGHDAWVTANKNVRADLSARRRRQQRGDHGLGGAGVRPADRQAASTAGRPRATSPAVTPTRSRRPTGSRGTPITSTRSSPTATARSWSRCATPGPLYLVSERTGRIIWTLGGKDSSFTIPSQAEFKWQHDAELHAGSTVTLFDDHCCDITGADTYLPATGPSRGLTLKLNPAGHTASLVRQYSHGTTFHSEYMGNTQVLPNGERRGRLGGGSVRVGVHGRRQADLRRGVPVARHELPRLRPTLGWPAAVPAERRRPRPGCGTRPSTPAGTERHRSAHGGCSP